MTREEKRIAVEKLTNELNEAKTFYLADIADLNAEQTSNIRREGFKNGIRLVLVKNTLLRKAMEACDKELDEMYSTLTYNTFIMFAETGNAPAKLIKKFREDGDKPVLKAAFIDECVYVGDENLDSLAALKSKEELIGDVIGLLQSPAKNVISALKSANDILAGVCKTLADKEE